MPRLALTDRFISGAKTDGAKQIDFFDSKCAGLALRVSNSGHKAWTLMFTIPGNGKRGRVALGNYPTLSLATARTRAIEAKGQLADGIDPRSSARHGASKITFGELAARYVSDPDKARLRSLHEIKRRLSRDILPIIGHITLAELTKRDVRDVTDPIMRRGSRTQAWHTHKDIRAMLGWAVVNDFLQNNPLDRVKPPGGFTPSERVLNDDEVCYFWNVLPTALPGSKACRLILQLCLTTGQRLGEVCGIRRSELDLDHKLWKLPAARTKNKHPHAVPLSDLAVRLIREALTDDDIIFPAKDGAALASPRVTRTVIRAHEEKRWGMAYFGAHDLRRTCLDGMARLGVQPHVIACCANHRSITKSGVTFAHYVQHSYEGEKRAALDLWASRLEAIIGTAKPAKIIALKKKG